MKKMIYRGITMLSLSLACVSPLCAQGAGVTVRSPRMERNGGMVTVSMDLDLAGLSLGSNETAVFIPMLVHGEQRQPLPSVSVHGRTRWYQAERSGKTGAETSSVRYGREETVSYSRTLPYRSWMDGARLVVVREDYGCCGQLASGSDTPGYVTSLGTYSRTGRSYDYRYVRPAAEPVKQRSLSGQAFIDFPVNSTELLPDFRGNRAELSRIMASIDSLREDADIRVTSLHIKGFASPEDSYSHNAELARGRTESLKDYVRGLYDFGATFITTDFEPEDWAGLRERVAASTLPHRSEILSVIDDASLEPDTKDWRLKNNYPGDYAYMLEHFFPALRRSEYSISYTVRGYASEDLSEIRGARATAPQKLSLAEMFLLAQSYEEGSEEFDEVLETAVRLFPNDASANLNAANVAMRKGDLSRAERYLAKAGTGAEADHARAILEDMRQNAAQARTGALVD